MSYQETYKPAVRADKLVYEYLKNAAESSAMNVDGSSLPVVFCYEAPASKVVRVESLVIRIRDATILPDKFGGVDALTNGVEVEFRTSADAKIKDPLGAVALKRNSDFQFIAHHAEIFPDAANGDTYIIHWDIGQGGTVVKLENEEKLCVIINDNLTGLTSFEMMVHGSLE